MSDGSVGRNENPEKIKFLFLSNTREHFYSQANNEFMFIPSDTKNGKNRGRFDSYG